MKRAFLIQPGKLGDIIINSPIADYYHEKGYKVNWFVFDTFLNPLKRLKNVTPITFNKTIDNMLYFSNKRLDFSDSKSRQESYEFFKNVSEYIINNKNPEDIILDICWGFPGSSQNNNSLISAFHNQNRNWIDMRYSLANVPLKNRWNFSWIRDEKKENELLKFIKNYSKTKYGSENFSICHNYNSNIRNIDLPNQINFSYVKGYEIFDWYKVLLEAQEVACVDSSLCNFIEVLPELKYKKKYYLGSEEPHYFEYMRNILLNNWYDFNNNKIISDYDGKI